MRRRNFLTGAAALALPLPTPALADGDTVFEAAKSRITPLLGAAWRANSAVGATADVDATDWAVITARGHTTYGITVQGGTKKLSWVPIPGGGQGKQRLSLMSVR